MPHTALATNRTILRERFYEGLGLPAKLRNGTCVRGWIQGRIRRPGDRHGLSFLVRQRPPLHKSYAPRDPVPVRGITATGLSSAQTVNTPDDNAEDRRGRDQHQDQERESPRHTPAVAVDPTTCELIQQQQDSATVPDLPDQALMRLRAYNRPASTISASGKGSADFEA